MVVTLAIKEKTPADRLVVLEALSLLQSCSIVLSEVNQTETVNVSLLRINCFLRPLTTCRGHSAWGAGWGLCSSAGTWSVPSQGFKPQLKVHHSLCLSRKKSFGLVAWMSCLRESGVQILGFNVSLCCQVGRWTFRSLPPSFSPSHDAELI